MPARPSAWLAAGTLAACAALAGCGNKGELYLSAPAGDARGEDPVRTLPGLDEALDVPPGRPADPAPPAIDALPADPAPTGAASGADADPDARRRRGRERAPDSPS